MLTVKLAGQEINGFSTSSTVTIWIHVAVLPYPSVAVQVILVAPNGNTVGALFEIITPVQLSVAVAFPYATLLAVHNPGSLLTVKSAGQVITGANGSTTVTIAPQEETFPFTSVNVNVTLFAPTSEQSNAVCEAT